MHDGLLCGVCTRVEYLPPPNLMIFLTSLEVELVERGDDFNVGTYSDTSHCASRSNRSVEALLNPRRV